MNQSAGTLPLQATPASYVRYRVAHALAALCPPVLGQEISVTGSVSKGLADEASDIEQVFYVQKLPDIQERDAWLHQIGASEILHDEAPIEDGSIWSTFRFREVWVEAGWQTFSQQEALLRLILIGQILDHHRLILAEVTTHALSLRSEGHLSRWQQQLMHYPPALAHRLVADAAELWKFPHFLAARWALIHRNEPWRLAELLIRELHNLLRVLFAVNHQWEPEWKWISQTTAPLVLRPDHLMERIAAIWALDAATHRIAVCFQLIYDTLVLLPPEYDVVQALRTVRESLDLHGY
ncbi:MAG TPA: DUF4037 domain-containing protein [Ktedonobacteraceae bacterium]